jgi:hypothetical protein
MLNPDNRGPQEFLVARGDLVDGNEAELETRSALPGRTATPRGGSESRTQVTTVRLVTQANGASATPILASGLFRDP